MQQCEDDSFENGFPNSLTTVPANLYCCVYEQTSQSRFRAVSRDLGKVNCWEVKLFPNRAKDKYNLLKPTGIMIRFWEAGPPTPPLNQHFALSER